MKRRAILVLLTLALLCVLAVSVSAAPATDPAVLNTVNEAAVQMTTDNVFAAGGTIKDVQCPYCNEKATWYALGAKTSSGALGKSGHYYLSGDLTSNAGYYVPAGGNLCLHLNGHSIKSTNTYAIAGGAGLELNIMGEGSVIAAGSNANGIVYGQGTVRLFGGSYSATASKGMVLTASAANANVYVFNGVTITGVSGATAAVAVTKTANFYLYGGTISGGKNVLYLTTGNTYLAGANINASNSTLGVSMPADGSATVYHSAGTVSGAPGGTACNVDVRSGKYILSDTGSITGGTTTKEYNSGNVIVTGTGVFTMTGGEITGGSGVKGGNVHVYQSSFVMEGGTISGGTASTGGGNVYIYKGSFTQSGGTITGGEAPNGGSVYNHNGSLTLGGGTISGGTADTAGGSVYVNTGSLTVNSGSITGGTAPIGGSVYNEAGTLTVAGGTISDGEATTAGGSVYLNGGTLDVTGGTISGGTAPIGGSVYNEAGALTVAGGTISGGTADTAGGSVYVNTGTLTVNSGSITGGEAPNGGSVYNEAGTLEVAGGTISEGVATTGGGSIYMNGGALDVTGGTISGGTAPSGGNVYVNGGTLTVNGGTITKGTANRAWHTSQWYYYGGGNIYVSDSSAAKANILSGTVSGGTATSNCGGNILCRGKGTLTVSGGTISGGNSGYPGANIANGASTKVTITGGTITGGNGDTMNRWAWDGDNVFAFGGTTTVSGGTIESDGKTQGNGILAWFNAKIVLDGNAMVTTAGKFGNIYIGKQSGTATLQVNNTFKGEAGVAFDAEHGVAYGATLALDSSTGAYTGNVYLEDLDNPAVLGTQENALVVAGTKVNDTWYQNNETAVAAATATDVIKLYTAADLDLQGAEYLVDLNGKSVNITGTGNVTCFDTVNLDFQNFGTATVNGPTLVNTVVTTQDGIRYYTISDENAHSFHALQAKVSSVSVRPSSAGVYYSCTWNCDSTLLEKLNITAYGVALSVKEMPVDGFTKDGHTLYTKVTEALVPNVKRNSVLVDKIFKTGENVDNNGRAQMPIFAVPYIEVNGETFVGTGVQYSLKNILEDLLDQEDVYFANREALENFYKTWETVMSGWDLSFIGKFPMNASDDGVLRFFLMGNSFTYYYVEELYTLLAANKPDGVDEIEIYNLYHSGSALKDHVEWWQNDAAEYEFYLTTGSDDEDAVYKRAYVNADKKWWTLDEALVTANWDYIGVQPSTTGLNIGYASAIGKSNEEMEEHLAAAFPYIETLMNHLYGYFPNVKFMWQRSWAPEIGRVSGSTTYTKESRDNYSIGLQRIQDYLTNVWDLDKPYDLIQVNCGAAWDEARALNDALETKLIPEVGGLCARLGVVNTGTYPPGEGYTNPGDGYHEGDIGGGQLLNAYVWYMTIMQTLDPDYTPDVSGSTYVPDYTRGHILKVEFVELLKNAAMSVFETAE